MNNGHEPAAAAGLMTQSRDIPCSACGTALSITTKFCPECGVQRTVIPVAAPAVATSTEIPDEEHASVTDPIPAGDTEATTLTEPPPDVGMTLPLPIVETANPQREQAKPLDERAELPDESTPAEPRGPWWRRRATLIAAAIVVLAGLAAAGFQTYQAMTRRPIVAALSAASAEFADAIATVSEAEDLEQVSVVASDVPGWIRTIETQRDALNATRDTALKTASLGVVDAQLAYLASLRPLADLDAESLADWTPLAESMEEATQSLQSAGGDLGLVDAAAAADMFTDTSSATNAVETGVAVASAENATAAVDRVIGDMSAATKLDGIHAGAIQADDAATELQAALTILEGLADGEETADRLTLQAAFLDHLAGLESLTEDTLATWPSTAVELRETGEEMVAGLDLSPAERSALTADLREMRSSLDGIVSSGRKKLNAWRNEVERAQEARDAELALLAEYESGYRTQMERYNDLRDSTADFTERIRDDYGVTYDEAYTAFYDGISQREEVREAMNALSPPDSVRSNHLAVVGVIDDAIAAMQAAVDGLADSQFCYFDCYYEDTAGWQRFQQESDRITDEFASVTYSWDAAISARRTELENLDLPAKPEI